MEEKKLILNWTNIAFIGFTSLVTLIGGPLYIWKYGLSGSEIALFAFFSVATGLGITVGYHRLFSHAAYKANAVVRFLMLFFGAAAFEQSALNWSGQHRDHHQFVDTDKDAYNIKKGFFWAHMGWLIFDENKFRYDHVKDLSKSKMLMHQHNNYLLWSVGAGVVFPVLLGALTGHALGAFIFAVCARITFVYHSTWFINSICHMFGAATYDANSTAKDHWFIAFLTYGEGYHNFHHRFPSDYRNAIRWYQWDPSKWLISFFEKIGWAWDLKRVSNFKIMHAKLVAENQMAKEKIEGFGFEPQLEKLNTALQSRFEILKSSLSKWEVAAREYQKVMNEKFVSSELRHVAMQKAEAAKKHFEQVYAEWLKFTGEKLTVPVPVMA